MADNDKMVKITNKSQVIVNSGQLRIMPGQSVQLPESKISEGLKRLLASPGSGLEKVTA
jgi:hypothetical protein